MGKGFLIEFPLLHLQEKQLTRYQPIGVPLPFVYRLSLFF
jgi:hypothetical protein